jgi:hypothetical protein
MKTIEDYMNSKKISLQAVEKRTRGSGCLLNIKEKDISVR